MQAVLSTDLTARDCASAVPLSRWDLAVEEASLGIEPVRFAMFLDDVASFDSGVFGLSANEALLMDPQQRLILECASEALSVGGVLVAAPHVASAGVFIVSYSRCLFFVEKTQEPPTLC